MPAPVVLTTLYLVVNAAFMIWIVRAELQGGELPSWVTPLARTLRYGPPSLGVVYLVTLADDWAFFLFVTAFFLAAFWLLGGLLNFPQRPPRR